MKNINKIGLIGYGVVGKAMEYALSSAFKIKKFDKYIESNSFEEVCESSLIFIMVPTPFDYDNNKVDLSAVEESLDKLSKANYKGVVAIKSTIPPKTTEEFSKKYNLEICFNPEFLREKTANNDCAHQNTVVIGALNENVFNLVKFVYQEALSENAEFFHVSPTEAEMIKYAQNTTLASRVAIANIIYDACKNVDIKYDKIKKIGFDRFDVIGEQMTEVPGPDGELGFGGKCLPKDIAGFNSVFKSDVIKAIINYNDEKRS